MKYWVIDNSISDTYVSEFETKDQALSYLKKCLTNCTNPDYFILIEGKELKITRSVTVNVSVEE